MIFRMETNMHPCLYVNLAGYNLEDAITVPSAFFLHSFDEPSIRSIKAHIQANDVCLNLMQVYIYIIATAQSTATDIATIVANLREAFICDFVSVGLYLCVFTADKMPVCASLVGLISPDIFSRIYILSDHNEYGEVNATNRETNIKLLAYLPHTHSPRSDFDQVLTAKSLSENRPAFVSVGFSQLAKPTASIYAAVRRVVEIHIAQLLEAAIVAPTYLAHDAPADIQNVHKYINNMDKLVKDFTSIPSRPTRTMHGKTVQAAEALLFGDDAMKFYRSNYTPRDSISEMIELVKEFFPINNMACSADYMEDLTPTNATTKEQYVTSLLSVVSRLVSILEGELSAKNNTVYRAWPFAKPIKKHIGEAYAILKAHDQINALMGCLAAWQKHIASYVHSIRKIIERLNAQEAPTKEPYYEKSANALLHTMPTAKLPIPSDLAKIDHAISEFVEASILPHPSIALSFEEDINIRASESTSPESFYKNIISKLYATAPLAIFLQRHDDLIYEDILLGPCAVLSQASKLPQATYRHTCLIENQSSITLLRLVGGLI